LGIELVVVGIEERLVLFLGLGGKYDGLGPESVTDTVAG